PGEVVERQLDLFRRRYRLVRRLNIVVDAEQHGSDQDKVQEWFPQKAFHAIRLERRNPHLFHGLPNWFNFRHCWDNLVVGVTEFIVAGGQILVADLVNGGLNWRADERSDDLPVLDVVSLGAAAITGFDWVTRQALQRHLFSNVANLKLALVGGKALGHVARLAWLGRLAFAALAQV